MNLINIFIANFKQFFKISLLILISFVFSLYQIFNYYKNSYIKIKTFDLVMTGNFSSVVFNKISQPIFQKYQSKKVYLKKNNTNNKDSRIYTLFYLDNKENEKFIKNWKLDLETYFIKIKKTEIKRDLEIKFPPDNIKISYKLKNILIDQTLSENLAKKEKLLNENLLKKRILNEKKNSIIENAKIEIKKKILNEKKNSIIENAKIEINNRIDKDKEIKLITSSIPINKFVIENKNEIIKIINSSQTIKSVKESLLTKKWENSKFLRLKTNTENKKNNLNLLSQLQVEKILNLPIYSFIKSKRIQDIKAGDVEDKKLIDVEDKKLINVEDMKLINVEDTKLINVEDTKLINVEDMKLINVEDTKLINAKNKNEVIKINKEINQLINIIGSITKDFEKIREFQKANIIFKKYFADEVQNKENRKYLSITALFILLLSYLVLNLYLSTIAKKS